MKIENWMNLSNIGSSIIKKTIVPTTIALNMLLYISACEQETNIQNNKDKIESIEEETKNIDEELDKWIQAANENKFAESLNILLKLEWIYKKKQDDNNLRNIYRIIGIVFSRQENRENSLIYYLKGLETAKKCNNHRWIILMHALVWEEYREQWNDTLAISTLLQWRNISENMKELNQKEMEAKVMIGTDIARWYFDKEDNLTLAKQYRAECIEINKKTNNIYNTIIIKYDLWDIELHIWNTNKAIKYYKEWLDLSKKNKASKYEELGYNKLHNWYKENKNRQEALKHKELEDSLKDERVNTESTQQVNELNTKYEVDKKETELLVKDATIQTQWEQKKKMIRWIISAIIATLGAWGFALSKIRHNKFINKQNQELTKQKAIIEKANQENKESMEAGKSVQEKIVLSDPEYIKKLFPESFVLFKPQNGIISGDFYRFKETKSGKKLFAAVDCTGHGIPGAFMSFIGSQILNEAVEYGLEKPSDILSFLDKKIIDIQSEQKDEDTFAKYGMDIALCSRDEQTKTLEYSWAVNPIYIINSNTQETKTREIKPNKSKIGYRLQGQDNEYQNDSIIITDPNTIIYLSSDGYQDQFWGKNGKKLKRSEFKKYLESSTKEHFAEEHPNMTKTQQSLEEKFKKRKGDEEQIDDMLIIGIKV